VRDVDHQAPGRRIVDAELPPRFSFGAHTSKKELQPPNYTQIPNALFGMMLSMTGAELKCVLAIARETFGWHRSWQEISLSRLMELTGLSRQGVINGLEEGMKRGVIERANEGQSYSYGLSVDADLVKKVDQSEVVLSSQKSRPEVVKKVDGQKSRPVKKVDRSGQKNRPEVVKLFDQPIKEDKEIKETLKESSPAAPAEPPKGRKINPAVEPFFGDFCLAYSAAYDGAPYADQGGDFVQLASLRKRWSTVQTPFEDAWARALPNYLATPQKKHTLADLCVNFATFQKTACDKYGKPVGASSNGQQRIVGEARPVPGKYSGIGVRGNPEKTG